MSQKTTSTEQSRPAVDYDKLAWTWRAFNNSALRFLPTISNA
jgi:hypothetical protein